MHACAVTVFRFLLISQLSCRACGSSNVSLRIYICCYNQEVRHLLTRFPIQQMVAEVRG